MHLSRYQSHDYKVAEQELGKLIACAFCADSPTAYPLTASATFSSITSSCALGQRQVSK